MDINFKWLTERLDVFRRLHLFEVFGQASLQDIAQHIFAQSLENEYYGELDSESEYLDFDILLYEKQRVWSVVDFLVLGKEEEFADNFYPKVLEKLASLSEGIFVPTQISTQDCGFCSGRSTHALLDFEWENKKHQIGFCTDLDILVLNYLTEINEIIAHTGYTYVWIYVDEYGRLAIFCLKISDKQSLEKVKNWHFQPTLSVQAKYWQDRAEKAKEQNEQEKALAYYAKSYACSPTLPYIVSQYATLLAEVGKKAKARKVYKGLIDYWENLPAIPQEDEWWYDFLKKEQKKLNK